MIANHPSDEALAQMAAGRLSAGPRLVVATHLGLCRRCRALVGDLEAVGGALLDSQPPLALRPDAFARTLALIDAPEREPEIARPAMHPEDAGLPAPLRYYATGPWRRLHPRLSWRWLALPEDPGARVIMLRAAAGQALPHHSHRGREFTQVISGGFSDRFGHYLPGDCIEADAQVTHRPVVDPDGECVVVAAIEDRLRLSSLFGRLVQPLIGL